MILHSLLYFFQFKIVFQRDKNSALLNSTLQLLCFSLLLLQAVSNLNTFKLVGPKYFL